jgi:hypothetical protein
VVDSATAAGVDPRTTYYELEIINMATNKVMKINMGYTYSARVELSMAIDFQARTIEERPRVCLRCGLQWCASEAC